MKDKIRNIEACVFDAYGTLFDVTAAAAHCKDELGQKWEPLAEIWRTKQLNYTWLRSLMDEYVGFWQVTEDALSFALETLEINNEGLKSRLLNLYQELDVYPEVSGVLRKLKQQGLTTAILSNGTDKMLDNAVRSADIGHDLDHVISVDRLKIYKPHPKVYKLAVDKLSLPAEKICFMSSNPWDISGGANFGFKAVWINRLGQRKERLPGKFVAELNSLQELPTLI